MASLSEKPEKSYECDQCDYQTSRADHFKNHTLCHSGENLKSFKKDMKVHKRNELECSLCQKKLKTLQSYKRHKLSHTSLEKKFSCSLCPLVFQFKNYLKIHERTHNNQKRYTCLMCPKTFSQQGNLKTHTKQHSQLMETLSCSMCPKTFADKKIPFVAHQKT